MNNKKRIVNLEYFREMLHICPRIPNQIFDELPFEEETLAFRRNLGHSEEIKKITYGMYHKKNVDFSYLLWLDFVYQIEHKDAKKSNEMYYPRDDQMLMTIKLVSRHQNTQQTRTSQDKASVRKTQSSSDTTMPPLTDAGIRLSTSTKGKQPAKPSKAKGLSVLSEVALTEAELMKLATKRSMQQTHISQGSKIGADEGTGIIPGVPDVPTYKSDEEISWKSSDEDKDYVDDQSDAATDDDDDQKDEDEQDDDHQDDNDDDQDSDNDGDDFVHPKLSSHDEEAKDEERGDKGLDAEDDDDFESLLLTAPTLPPPSTPIISQVQQAPAPSPASTSLQDLLNFGSLFGFDHRLKTLEANFSKFMQTNRFAEAVSSIPNIVDRYIYHWMNEAVKIEKTVNEQLEAKVLTQASNSSNTSYVVAADLSELELKKILIEKMESNKSINRSGEQRNLYKALVDAYECDKIILDTYGDTVTLKRHRDDEDKDEEPSVGSDRGSKRRQARKEPESTSAPKEKTSKTSGKSTEGSKSY
nr:hypothetical protein [Tanacetum cinerariifolium]